MAIKYEVKKVVFGFDKTNTEKFVAQTKVLGLVKFDKLCEEVQKVSMAPRGVVDLTLVSKRQDSMLYGLMNMISLYIKHIDLIILILH